MTFLLAFSLCFFSCSLSTQGKKINPTASGEALLVLDIQNDFLQPDGALPVDSVQGRRALAKINELIDQYSAEKREIIYVKNEFSPFSVLANLFRNHAALRGSPGAEFHDSLHIKSQKVFTKDSPDAFSNEGFDKYLRAKEIKTLIIVGVFADQCVYYTMRGAISRGYTVLTHPEALAAANPYHLKQGKVKMQDLGISFLP